MNTFRQGLRLKNVRYLEIVKSKVEVFEQLGSKPRTSMERINNQFKINNIDLKAADSDQVKTSKEQAREEFLCYLIIFKNICV